jgi:hypothetical protein
MCSIKYRLLLLWKSFEVFGVKFSESKRIPHQGRAELALPLKAATGCKPLYHLGILTSKENNACCRNSRLLIIAISSIILCTRDSLEGFTEKAARNRGQHLQVHCPTTKPLTSHTPINYDMFLLSSCNSKWSSSLLQPSAQPPPVYLNAPPWRIPGAKGHASQHQHGSYFHTRMKLASDFKF